VAVLVQHLDALLEALGQKRERDRLRPSEAVLRVDRTRDGRAWSVPASALVGEGRGSHESGEMFPQHGCGSESRLLTTFAFDHRLQHGFEGDFSSSRAGIAVLELNPAVVEAIQHPNSGGGILHALRSE
jgi:hypothetical protein